MAQRLRFAFALLLSLLFGVWASYFGTGWSPVLLALGGGVLGFLLYYLLHGVLAVIGRALGFLPKGVSLAVLAAVAGLVLVKRLGFGWPDNFYYPVGIVAVAVLVLGVLLVNRRGRGAKIWGVGLPLVLGVAGVAWLLGPGHDPFAAIKPAPRVAPGITTLAAAGLSDPATPGEYSVATYTYGSGTDARRPEYATGVKYVTPTLDATRLLPEWEGKKKKWREHYWQFGVDRFPLNARVYQPVGKGPFPLAVIVHGNHSMIDYSDGGYAYLGELLASRGILTVSVDQNFVNGHWSGDFRGREMPTRAWLLLKHLEQWRTWNQDPGHELYGKVDMERILLLGHSRGGEAVTIAAAFNRLSAFPDDALETFDFNFGIRGVVSIAPTDYRYHRRITPARVSYLSLQGSYDADEVSFWGLRPYRRLRFTMADSTRFKAGVYLHRANHGQFNTDWGRTDFGGTSAWLLNTAPLLSGEAQRRAAAVFISAFAEATLKNNRAYLPLLRNSQSAGKWLPDNHYLNHYAEAGDLILQDFEEDIDPTVGADGIRVSTQKLTIWREEDLITRDDGSQENHVLVVGWDQREEDAPASYTLLFPDTLRIDSAATHLLITLAGGDVTDLPDTEEADETQAESGPPDPRITLTDRSGRERSILLSEYKPLAPTLPARFMKTKELSEDQIGRESEIQLETFRLPLALFSGIDDGFDLSALARVTLVFLPKTRGVLVVDEIGFGR